jgi:hypothetical protein
MYVYVFKTRQTIAQELGIYRSTLIDKLLKANIILEEGLVPPTMQQIIYDFFHIYPPGWVNLPKRDPNNQQQSPRE